MKRPIRVLISEDNDTWQMIFKRSLGKANYEVKIANNLVETKDQLEHSYFNLVLVDISLDPDNESNTDGIETLKIINKLCEGTQAIVLTGFGTVPIVTSAFRDYDVFHFLEKQSFDETSFLKIVTDAINKSEITFTQLSLSLETLYFFKNINFDRASTLLNTQTERLKYLLRYLIRETSPILPQQEMAELINSGDSNVIKLDYWSKAYASRVRLTVGNKKYIKLPETKEIVASLMEDEVIGYVELQS